MNTLQIKYFLGIVNNDLNFTKASKSLFVSQPALSKHIDNLEKDLSVQLFDTTRKAAVKLTPGGKLFYDFFAEFNDNLKTNIEKAKKLNNQPSGELKVAIFPGWGELLMLGIQEFLQKYPGITIDFDSVSYKTIKIGILNNDYDLAITAEDQFKETTNICTQKITDIPWILIYSRNHLLAKKEQLQIMDFKDDIFYTLSSDEMPWLNVTYESYCRSKGFIPKIKTYSNLESIFLALESGQGYTILDKWVRVKNNIAYKYFELDNSLTVCAAWKKDNHNSALRLFLENCLAMQNGGC